MRIWVLSNEFGSKIIGGLGTVATQLSLALANDGDHVTVICNHSRPNVKVQRFKSLDLVRFPKTAAFYSRKMQKHHYTPIVKWLKRKGFATPEIIHVHSVQFANVAGYYKKKGVPVVYTCHSLVTLEKSTAFRRIVAERQKKLLKLADLIVVPSQWQRKMVEKMYPYCAEKVEVIENGVHVRTARASGNRKRLLYVGRLTPKKGIEELLEAVALLANGKSKVSLDVVGTGSRTYTAKLKAKARRLRLRGRVKWLGFRNPAEVQRLYPRYGAVVVPSKQESFGLVALEALANQTALISTRSGGLEQFVNNEVAEVIPRVGKREIATAIRQVWSDEALTRSRIEAGVSVANRYSWSRAGEAYKSLFRKLVD